MQSNHVRRDEVFQSRQEIDPLEDEVPSKLRSWVTDYRETRKIYIPGTDVDVGYALWWAMLFSLKRLLWRYALYWLGWPRGSLETYFTSACIVSMYHSVTLLFGLYAILRSQKYVPSGKLQPSPSWYKDATHSLMSFCTGYMIYDSFLGYVVETWQPGKGPVLTADDKLYLGHHILTTLYMTSARYMKAGHMSAMSLMFNGEFSAPIMNLTFILEKMLQSECCGNFGWLPSLYVHIEQLFSIVYLLCRVAVSPFVIGHVTFDLLFTKNGRKNVPLWLSLLWMPLCWGVQFGSIGWIMTCIDTIKTGPFGKGLFGTSLNEL